MSDRTKRTVGIVALVIALPLVLWIVYNAGFWVGEMGTRTTP
ncbi:hypothetical protein AAG596_12860 [Citromicrobium bathyomarinum]|nr:hypothetical protein [Citromicrobium sp. JLT1363]